MAVKRVVEGVHVVPMGMANAFSIVAGIALRGGHVVPMGMANAYLIEGDDGLTLIDAGCPGKEAAVFGAIRGLGRTPDQLKHLIFTHGHPDHIGSALRSCGKPVRGPTCIRSISLWPRMEALFDLCGRRLVCCGE